MNVDDFIDYGINSCPTELYARWFLHNKRLPAVLQIEFEPVLRDFKLFCEWEGETYRVTGASSMGDVWLTSNMDKSVGYDKRVNVENCSHWSKVL